MKITMWMSGLALGLGALALQAAPQEISFSRAVKPILVEKCSRCHGADKGKSGLRLGGNDALANLLNVASKEVPGMVRVKPGDPEQSYLWLKLDDRASEGSGMPKTIFSSKKLPQDQLALIKAWIAGGAKE